MGGAVDSPYGHSRLHKRINHSMSVDTGRASEAEDQRIRFVCSLVCAMAALVVLTLLGNMLLYRLAMVEL